jgi:hypothetical protein
MSRRTITWHIAAAATAVAAVTAVGAGPAAANDGGHQSTYQPQHKGPGKPSSNDNCAFTVGGQPWSPGQGLASIKPSDDGRISIGVSGHGGKCTVSLAAYLAHGPDFASSGQQVLLGFSTVTVKKHKHGTLTVSAPDAGCFAQIDLYKGSTEYDGGTGKGHGPAPAGPNGGVIGADLLASWNGPADGKDCADTTPSTPPTSPSSPTDSPSASPSDSATSSPSTSATDTTVSGGTGSTTSPATGDTGTPSPSPSGSLAHTGGGGNTGLIATLAVVLVALGGAVTFMLRRRGAGRAH